MSQITEAEKTAFRASFDSFDVNKDGHITTGELTTVLKKLGQNPSTEEVADFVKVCDKDKNGTIEFNEFCSYLVNFRRKLFNEIDTDNSGYITADEVVNMYQKLGVSVTMVEAKKIVAESDTDKDGQISFDEFSKSLHKRPIL